MTSCFAALAHPGRLSVFRRLVRAGPDGMAAGEISRALATPPATLSAQLSVLATAGLISGTREGRSIRYAVNVEAVSAMVLYLLEDCCGGRPEICAPIMKALDPAGR